MDKKEIVPIIAGAATIAAIKGADELYYNLGQPGTTNKFPFVKTINPLPPVDDWLILAIPAAITGAGIALKNKGVRNFGIGG